MKKVSNEENYEVFTINYRMRYLFVIIEPYDICCGFEVLPKIIPDIINYGLALGPEPSFTIKFSSPRCLLGSFIIMKFAVKHI